MVLYLVTEVDMKSSHHLGKGGKGGKGDKDKSSKIKPKPKPAKLDPSLDRDRLDPRYDPYHHKTRSVTVANKAAADQTQSPISPDISGCPLCSV